MLEKKPSDTRRDTRCKWVWWSLSGVFTFAPHIACNIRAETIFHSNHHHPTLGWATPLLSASTSAPVTRCICHVPGIHFRVTVERDCLRTFELGTIEPPKFRLTPLHADSDVASELPRNSPEQPPDAMQSRGSSAGHLHPRLVSF